MVRTKAVVVLLSALPIQGEQRIALTHDHDGDLEVCLIDASGGQHLRLTESPGTDSQPAWSTDGEVIAFVTDRTGMPSIWVMQSDGSRQRQAHRSDLPSTDGLRNPSWSSDGKLAYLSQVASGPRGSVWYQDSIPGDAKELDFILGDSPWSLLSVIWGPSGNSIAITSEVSDHANWPGRGALTSWLFDDVVGNTATPLPVGNPSFSKDGIAVFDADGDLWVGGLFEGSFVNITESPATAEVDPDWSQDGETIAYHAEDWIWISRSDGTEARMLIEGADPAWAPTDVATDVAVTTWGTAKSR